MTNGPGKSDRPTVPEKSPDIVIQMNYQLVLL